MPSPAEREKCPGCGDTMPINSCIQPWELNGRIVCFHIGCFEPWYDKEIPVLRVTHDGSSFVTRDPYTPEAGEEVTLTWETMKQGKYWTLKEFQGF